MLLLEIFRKKAAARLGSSWARGTAVYDYSNDQAASTMWVHDHTLGLTPATVYAGLAPFYLLRGDRPIRRPLASLRGESEAVDADDPGR